MRNLVRAGVFSSVLCMTAAFAVTARAAAIVADTQDQICSRDYNAWGKPSVCQCPESSSYEARIGSCLIGSLESIQTQGQVVPALNAVDDGSAEMILQANELGDLNLVLPIALQMRLASGNYENVDFLVKGDLIQRQEPGMDDRLSLIVNSMTPITTFSP
jgi:hypothetical protein